MLSYSCDDEDDFINKSILLINKMKKYNEIKLYDMFFGNRPVREAFHLALEKTLENIKEVKKIPIEKRTYL